NLRTRRALPHRFELLPSDFYFYRLLHLASNSMSVTSFTHQGSIFMHLLKQFRSSLCIALLTATLGVSSGKSASAQSNLPAPAPLSAYPGLAMPEEPEDIINELLDSGQIIRSNDVKRGMRGYGLSVFQGTTI